MQTQFEPYPSHGFDGSIQDAGGQEMQSGGTGAMLSRNGSTMRTNAVAMLKRAASQREMRSKSPGPNLGLVGEAKPITPPQDSETDAGSTVQVSPMLVNHAWTPSPANLLSETLSPTSQSPDSGALHIPRHLQEAGKRSPLPSLEQLRARILQERATDGLARSGSTSMASAAARQYAMEKLLGQSGREGAVSPVSDTAEDEEEQEKRDSAVKVGRHLLRRSRTIGGLSAAAEAQRKAAFVEALDQGVPDDIRSARRSSRRFAHAPPGSMARADSDMGSTSKLAPLPESDATTLERNASQRQQARTEMLRKLSTRRGARSPADALDHVEDAPAVSTDRPTLVTTPAPDAVSENDRRTAFLHPNEHGERHPRALSSSPPASPNVHTPFTPSPHAQSRLLTVPLGSVARATSTHSSATAVHEDERNRASAMARLYGEEAFEYERLLEMGYSTDDAYERVASARSGSYVDQSAAVSPRSAQEEFSAGDQVSPATPLMGSMAKMSEHISHHAAAVILSPGNAVPRNVSPTHVSDPNTTQTVQEEWVSKHPSEASIPLGFDAGMVADNEVNDEPNSAGGGEVSRPANRGEHTTSFSAYPESVVAASSTSLSSSNRDSVSRTARPPNLTLPPTNGAKLDRIEDLLTPGFLSEVGNPLDYSHSPARSPQTPRNVAALHDLDSDTDQSADGADITADQDDYLAHVDKMTRRLERFMNKSKRTNRDGAVQSSKAQVQDVQIDDNTAIQEAQLSPEVPPKDIVSRAASASPVSEMVRGSASDAAQGPPALWNPNSEGHTTPYSSNEKLAPFPGLLLNNNGTGSQPAQQTQPTQQQQSKIVKRKPSPLASAALEAAAKAVNTSPKVVQEPGLAPVLREHDTSFDGSATPSKETFFTSLRRKASRKAAGGDKAVAENAQPGETNTKKLASFLTRKTSGKQLPISTPSPLLDQVPIMPVSDEVVIIGHEAPAGESAPAEDRSASGVASVPALEALRRKESHHSRNVSVTSINTVQQADDLSLTLDTGHANQPSGLTAPAALAPATAAVLQRYSRVLTAPNQPSTLPEIPGVGLAHVENPPRRFIMAAPVLQVVTTSTVKDRFVFLFSDLVIFAKPARAPSKQTDKNALPTLAWTFAVKTILSLDDIKLTTPKGERRQIMAHTPLMRTFVSDFYASPANAIQSVIAQSGLPNDLNTMAKLLHQTPDLDRERLSGFLLEKKNEQLMRAFVYQEKFAGVSIESALRSLLLELRFPPGRDALQEMLVTFAQQWTDTNRGLIKDTFTSRLAVDLVLAIMSLNDAIHSPSADTPGYFSDPDETMTKEKFIQQFRKHDQPVVLSDRTLLRIYTSVSTDVIQQNMLPNEEPGKPFYVRILAPGVPNRIVYGQPSDPIRIAIPRVDAGFVIRLYGQDMTFQPQILTFDKSHVQEFRVLSKSLGPHSIVFVKAGRHARHYRSSAHDVGEDFPLPRSINISVQRAFMQHCFSLTVPDKRRFMVSVEDEGKRKQWLRAIKEGLDRQQKAARARTAATVGGGSAHALALHVLREMLIKPDVPAGSSVLQRSASSATPASSKSNYGALAAAALSRAPSDTRALLHPLHGIGAAAMGLTSPAVTRTDAVSRQESISRHYYGEKGAGHNERDLIAEGGGGVTKKPLALPTIPSGSDQIDFRQQNPATTPIKSTFEPLSGNDLILTVRQNSLLSLAISHAQQTQSPSPSPSPQTAWHRP